MTTPLSAEERFARLRLCRTPRIGPVSFRQLIERFGGAVAALDALPNLARGGAGAKLTPAAVADIEREIAAGEALSAQWRVWGDADYPALLAATDGAPPVLWLRGALTQPQSRTLAMVGARNASAAGLRFARSLAADLGPQGFIVVSGLARGVDGAAHTGALAAGTIAVLAGGVDDVYPPEHAQLYAQILERGVVISENPPGVRAQARDFPRRNRIISGLSLGVVVVEAELRSGSLITARLAGEQGREVFAVPGSPLDPRAKGVNDLIRHGAVLCEGVDDILQNLADPGFVLREYEPVSVAPPRAEIDPDDVESIRARVRRLCSPTAISQNAIASALDAPVHLVLAALVELSLGGEVELLPGGLVCAL